MLSITVEDLAGHQASHNITFSIDLTKPTAEVDFPKNNSVIHKPLYISANASDENGIFYMVFEIIEGNATLDSFEVSESDYKWLFNTTEYTEGEYLLRLVIYDNAGNNISYEALVTLSTSDTLGLFADWIIIGIILAVIFSFAAVFVLSKKDIIAIPKIFDFKTLNFLNNKPKKRSKKKSRKSTH